MSETAVTRKATIQQVFARVLLDRRAEVHSIGDTLTNSAAVKKSEPRGLTAHTFKVLSKFTIRNMALDCSVVGATILVPKDVWDAAVVAIETESVDD